MAQNQRISSLRADNDNMPLLHGAIAGFVATIPMTVFMLTTQRFLPKGQRYDLPPEIITKELAELANFKQHMNKQQILSATLASHFAYGAAMGMIYSPVIKRIPLPAAMKGIIFGLVIWMASYLGLLPLIGISASADDEPLRRNMLMIAAHVIWGATTGVVADVLGHQ
ncbi:MAG: hypothetical protein NVS4B9_33470 [Ktedonobacteraceae bacterium]